MRTRSFEVGPIARRSGWLLLLLLMLATPLRAEMLRGLEGPTPAEAGALEQARHDHTAYTLPPDELRKAVALHRIEETLAISSTVWTPLEFALILWLGWAAGFRNAVERAVRWRIPQTVLFLLLLAVTTALLGLPVRIYAHHVGLAYGLSVQGWGSWLGDRAKSVAIEWAIASFSAVIVLAILRRSPRWWWLWTWPIFVLLTLAGVLLTPYVIDPLFNHFEPLALRNPALVAELERVVQRSGIAIPPDRMFLMRASDKVTGLNAYVTGFGPSKRIVVWDTTVAHSSPDEIADVFGHELGHYALGHVLTGTTLACLGLLPLLWLTDWIARALLVRFGAQWRVRDLADLAALPVLLLAATLVSSLTDPIGNVVSRRMEHNADVYGQEVVHGIVVDPQATGRKSFQTLGETSLDDPTPHPVFDAWFDTHPPTWERTAFVLRYDPWAAGAAPKYFPAR